MRRVSVRGVRVFARRARRACAACGCGSVVADFGISKIVQGAIGYHMPSNVQVRSGKGGESESESEREGEGEGGRARERKGERARGRESEAK